MDYPLNLVGLGGKCTSPLWFVIMHVQVREIMRYDKDVVFLVVPDESEFGWRVPLVRGTCTIGRIINVIRESEIDHLSTPWATVRMVQLLSCWSSTAVPASGSVETQFEDVDELVTVTESVCLGPFQTKIIEGWVRPPLGDTVHVMVTPLRWKADHGKANHFPLDSMSFMHIPTSRTAAVRCPLWSETFPTATSSSRRECLWHRSCQHHWCHPLSYHQRWKPL